MQAMQRLQLPMFKLLLRLGADLNAIINQNNSDTLGECLMDVAICKYFAPMARLLVELGVSVKKCSRKYEGRVDEVLRDEMGKLHLARPDQSGWNPGFFRGSWVGRDF